MSFSTKIGYYAGSVTGFDNEVTSWLNDGVKSNIKKVKHIPTTFVHGRFDFICPMEMAWEMHKQLPKSKMIVVQAGHSVSDKEVADAVTKASDDFKVPK